MSLFGIKIGKPVDVALYEKSGTVNCYVFKPTKHFRRFDSYSLKVAPKSHLVYQITAKAVFCRYGRLERRVVSC